MSLEFSPPELSRELLSDQAYDVIRTGIIDGSFAPGQQLVEYQIARQLGISQAPVREALRKLSHEGLVTAIPRRGSFVSEVSEAEADQAREVRCALEELGARLTTGQLKEPYRARLWAIVESMREAAKQRDIATFRVLDANFHRTCLEASGNTYLARLWPQIEPSLLVLHVVSSARFSGDWERAAELHVDLINTLEGDDPEASAFAFRQHVMGRSGIGFS